MQNGNKTFATIIYNPTNNLCAPQKFGTSKLLQYGSLITSPLHEIEPLGQGTRRDLLKDLIYNKLTRKTIVLKLPNTNREENLGLVFKDITLFICIKIINELRDNFIQHQPLLVQTVQWHWQ